jgi:hypothetical protein
MTCAGMHNWEAHPSGNRGQFELVTHVIPGVVLFLIGAGSASLYAYLLTVEAHHRPTLITPLTPLTSHEPHRQPSVSSSYPVFYNTVQPDSLPISCLSRQPQSSIQSRFVKILIICNSTVSFTSSTRQLVPFQRPFPHNDRFTGSLCDGEMSHQKIATCSAMYLLARFLLVHSFTLVPIIALAVHRPTPQDISQPLRCFDAHILPIFARSPSSENLDRDNLGLIARLNSARDRSLEPQAAVVTF